jgi:NAD(P)-dependent dehydrogenase (short-subunit alcohol dehydrogenase family)
METDLKPQPQRIADYFAIAGATTLIITARHRLPLQKAKASIEQLAPKCKVVTAVVDISDEGSVETLFSDLRNLGVTSVPDVLVNNAGACESVKSIVDSDPEQWWRDSVSPVEI